MINKKVFDVMYVPKDISSFYIYISLHEFSFRVPLHDVYMLNENEKMDQAARQTVTA